MTFLAFTSLSNCIAAYSMAILTWTKCPDRPLARVFSAYLLSVGTWALFHFLWRTSASPAEAERWFLILMTDATWINLLLLCFVYTFTHRLAQAKKLLIGLAILNVGDTVLGLTGHFYSNFTLRYGMEYWPDVSWKFHFFLVFWQLQLAGACYLLFRHWKTSTGIERQQSAYLLIAHVIAYIGGNSNWFGLYGIYLFPQLNILVTGYVLILTYAMVRHRLLDVSLVLRKTLIYSLVTLVLALLYALVISLMMVLSGSLIGQLSWKTALIVAAVTALVFQPVVSWIRELVDRRYPRESLNQSMLREATGHFVHEIRTPLAHMTLPAQLAQQDLESLRSVKGNSPEILNRIDQRLRYIVEKSQEAAGLIQAVSDLTGDGLSRRDPIDLNVLIKDAVTEIQPRMDQQGITLSLEQPSQPVPLIGHPRQLQIALSNLLKNAADAMSDLPAGRPRELRLRLETEKGKIQLDISDTGKGISPEALPRLFDPWFTTKGSKGMGIGLYLTKEILRRHHATIEVNSTEGVGTVFEIRFPDGAAA